jgi:hypothetical protein
MQAYVKNKLIISRLLEIVFMNLVQGRVRFRLQNYWATILALMKKFSMTSSITKE